MNIKEAANVAWHARVNGMDDISRENLAGALAVLERLAQREPLVQELLSTAAVLPTVDTVDTMNRDVYAVWRSATRVRDFKV